MPANNITTYPLGVLMHTAFQKGVRGQLTEECKEFDMINMKKVMSEGPASEISFALEEGRAPSSIRWVSQTSPDFPIPQKTLVNAYVARMKEITASLDIESNLWDRANKTPHVYAKPLLQQANALSIDIKRRLAIDLHGDGTGVIAQVAAAGADDTNIATGVVVIPIAAGDASRGYIGHIEIRDRYVVRQLDGTLRDPTLAGGAPIAAHELECIAINRTTGLATFRILAANSANTVIQTAVASNYVATDVLVRSDTAAVDLNAPIADYALATDIVVGFEGLFRPGITVHGINQTGVLAPSRFNNNGAALGQVAIENMLNNVKDINGRGALKYQDLICSSAARSRFMFEMEADKRFQMVDDLKRGAKSLAYVHEDDNVLFNVSSLCRPDRLFLAPTDGPSGPVLEYHFQDLEEVKGEKGESMFLAPAAGGGSYSRRFMKFWQGYASFICKRPSALVSMVNFTV